jgi:hypothetical protein
LVLPEFLVSTEKRAGLKTCHYERPERNEDYGLASEIMVDAYVEQRRGE